MENYTIEDIKDFLASIGYTWNGEILINGAEISNVDISTLYGRTRPIVMFVLYKNNQQISQPISVYDISLKFFEEQNESSHSKFALKNDYSTEWSDFLAQRHNATENL